MDKQMDRLITQWLRQPVWPGGDTDISTHCTSIHIQTSMSPVQMFISPISNFAVAEVSYL